MCPLSDNTKSQGKGGLSEAMWGFQGKGPVGSSPYSPPGTFSALCVAYGGGKGTFQAPMNWQQGQLGQGWLHIDWKLSLGPVGTTSQA